MTWISVCLRGRHKAFEVDTPIEGSVCEHCGGNLILAGIWGEPFCENCYQYVQGNPYVERHWRSKKGEAYANGRRTGATD